MKDIDNLFNALDKVDYYIELSRKALGTLMNDFFMYVPKDAIIPLKEPCDINTWNRGYDFTVTGFKKRGDDSIMMCGTYCGKDDTEFLSYIYGFDSIKKLSVAIKASFFQSISF